MKQTISFCNFADAFNSIRPDNFSYDGLNALYDWLIEYEDSTGEEMELDVIALCCDFSEYTIDEIIDEYEPEHYDSDVDVHKDMDDDERREFVIDWLNEQTIVIPVNDITVIVQAF